MLFGYKKSGEEDITNNNSIEHKDNPYSDELPEWRALPDGRRVKEWYMLSSNWNCGDCGSSVPEEATDFSWYLQAAGKGDVCAQYVVGKMYIEGKLTDRNPMQAGLWFAKASESGNPFADYELAKMCESGTGIDENIETAKSLYKRAYDGFLRISSKKHIPAIDLLISVICNNSLADTSPKAETKEDYAELEQNKKDEIIGKNTEQKIIAYHYENIPVNCIFPMPDNPYNSNDTDLGLQSLAKSIQIDGLINPLSVNKKSDSEYIIIAGERRYKAITHFLHWNAIPCMVYHDIAPDTSQRKLHASNIEVREYTTEQKLKFHICMENLLTSMIVGGKCCTISEPILKNTINTVNCNDSKLVIPEKDKEKNTDIFNEKLPPEEEHAKATPKRAESDNTSVIDNIPDKNKSAATGNGSNSISEKVLLNESDEPDGRKDAQNTVTLNNSTKTKGDVSAKTYTDPTSYTEAIYMLQTLPLKPGQSCKVLIDDDIIQASVDRIELYENALIISVMVEDVRRSYPVSRIGTDLLIEENS